MITEDYCSFELSKLLKEKGFDVPCKYAWHGGIKKPDFHRHSINFNGGNYKDLRTKWYSAPTHQMAMKWLREVHGLNIFVIQDEENQNCFRAIIQSKLLINGRYGLNRETYEEAVDAALKYSLENLI